MVKIRITREFRFETSHVLHGYDGLCRNIHGHSYRLLVTVSGEPISENNPKKGMVMDFGDLKKIVNESVVDLFDHSLIVSDNTPEEVKTAMRKTSERVIFTPYQPTSENMVADIAGIIINKMPANVKLCCVKLFETNNSYAEWLASDNPE